MAVSESEHRSYRGGAALGRMWQWLRWEAAAIGRSARRAAAGPGPERDVVTQSLKAAGAAAAAWALTGWWWNAPMALMAPWTAVVLVQSTVYRSLRSGVQQLVVIALGTVLAAGAANLTGDTMTAMVLVLPVAVLIGNYARFGEHGLYAPTTAVFVLAYGSYSGVDILHRLFESAVGAVIGIAVNALILPPVHLRSVRDSLRRLPEECADLLHAVADGLREGYGRQEADGWHDRARHIPAVLADLRDARLWTRESYRLNPGHRLRRTGAALPPTEWDQAWERIADPLVALMRTLASTVSEESPLRRLPDAAVAQLAELLGAAGDVCAADRAFLGGRGRGARQERARALESAWSAHGLLKRQLVEQDSETATSLGGLVAQSQQLLHELAPVEGEQPAQGGRPSHGDRSSG
ncbi:FUSC family protein [Streptomyces chryseus]|uniref:FUSC family protein n=1 Tax=Streptomyces chryseus TaxID=68186 RepID=A0ABQ3DL31_9ACTN|nr:aromatic acid exporter family protein [Streptomyces chryseus]GHB01827.1 FUSC family protein [Streptomyces chryseus]